MAEAGRILEFLGVPFAMSMAAVLLFSRMAPLIGAVDMPGGRKQHGKAVPLVGGLAIFFSLLASAFLIGFAPSIGYFLFAISVVIAVGLWDDVVEISPRLKFVIQICASAIMIWGAQVHLAGLGNLVGYRPIGLSFLAVPLTMFAIVGVVNAINMVDGMDGLAGLTTLSAFAWYAIVALDSGLQLQFDTALLFCGAIAGFLIFNLRFPWQHQARVFLGDAGSLMIGFALGWFAIDLTQGAGRVFPPIAALWVVLLPLADCVSLMTRRLRRGKSPFVADRHHIHHYLLARGFSHAQTLAVLTGVSVVFGAIGYFGWRLHCPESILFLMFVCTFFAYHFRIERAWRRLEQIKAAQPALSKDTESQQVVSMA